MLEVIRYVDGLKGWECIAGGAPYVEIEQPDERTISIIVTTSSGEKISKDIKFPVMIYRGIWKEGAFDIADVVTYAGSLWCAEKSPGKKPGEPDSGWKLIVKAGRDGKDATKADVPYKPVRLT